jgi:hypothetical protein
LFEFFFGTTLLADVDALISGEISPAQFYVRTNEIYALCNFLSDARLKINKQVVFENMFGDGVHLYEFEWSDEAVDTYNKKPGRFYSVMAQDVARIYPDQVSPNSNGHLELFPDVLLIIKDPVYRAILIAAKSMNDVSGTVSGTDVSNKN